MDSDRKINWGRVLILAGAVIASTISSEFATGQEIIQYYTAHGVQGIFTALLLAVRFAYYSCNFAKAGTEKHFEKGNDVYKFYYDKYIGTFMDYYSTVSCYMSFFVMVGDAAPTLSQQYGLPSWVGGVVLTTLAILTAIRGLSPLVDKVGVVGPAIIALCIGIDVITLFRDAGNVGAGLEVIRAGALVGVSSKTIENVGPDWVMSALSYAGSMPLWFTGFAAAFGISNKKKDVEYGIYGGTVAVCAAIAPIMLAQVANINTVGLGNTDIFVWSAGISNLVLAEHIWKPFASLFAVVVFASICTTVVPLLYNPYDRFAKEGTSRFKILTVTLGIIGLTVGLFLPFRVLVNIVYMLNGYMGVVLMLSMLWKNIRGVFLGGK